MGLLDCQIWMAGKLLTPNKAESEWNMTNTKTIQEVAGEMSANLETKTRTNGEQYICNKVNVEWQKDIIRKAHGDKLPDDYVYRFISQALDVILEAEDGAEEDAIYTIEPDCYTSDLTNWLASRNDRLYYLTEALEEYEIKDGFQALAAAQQKEIQEVALALLEGIREYIETLE